jgi:hypothetical protein
VAPKKPSWATDPLEGAVGKDAAGALRNAGRYIGGGLQDFLGSQAVRESPFGAASSLFAPRKAYAIGTERQGPYLPDRLQRAPQAPVLPAPITSPNTTYQNADEEYKTLLSQYGGTSGVQQLAGMQSLPTGFTPTGGKQAAGLEDYYAAQRAVGAKNIGEITGALAASDPRYQKGGTLERWAIANPDLAMREFNKKFPTGAPTQGPSDEAIRAAMGGGTYFPSEGSPSPVANAPTLAGQTSFSNVANAVPAPPQQQGAAVSAPYAEANAQAAKKTAGETGMPNLPTTLDKVGDFLNSLTPFVKAAAPTGLSPIIYNPYR